MQTLSAFKRELKEGMELTMVECSFPNKLLNIPRKVSHVNSVGFGLWTETKNGLRKSYMNFPKAPDYSYNEVNQTFKMIFDNDYFIYKIT